MLKITPIAKPKRVLPKTLGADLCRTHPMLRNILPKQTGQFSLKDSTNSTKPTTPVNMALNSATACSKSDPPRLHFTPNSTVPASNTGKNSTMQQTIRHRHLWSTCFRMPIYSAH